MLNRLNGWKALHITLDLILIACCYGFALSLRILPPESVTIDADWDWFLRVSNEYSNGLPRLGLVQFLYTSLPCAYYGFVTLLFDDPLTNFRVWSSIEALAIPLTYLCVRLVAGTPSAIFGALIIALSAADISMATGLKSPYFISTCTALMCLGIWGAVMKRFWGPPLMVLGAAAAVSMHIGLWIMALWVSALALLFAFLQPRGQAIFSFISALSIGLIFSAAVFFLDYENLKQDIHNLSVQGPPQVERPPVEALIDRAHQGLGLPAESWENYQLAMALGCLALLWHLFQWVLRVRSKGEEPLSEQNIGALVGGLLITVASTALAHYGYLAINSGYLEYHHLVSLTPILIIMACALVQGLVPIKIRFLHGLLPLLLLVPWTGHAHHQYRLDTERRLRIPPDNSHLDYVLSLSQPIRLNARLKQHQPAVFTYFPKTRDHRPTIIANVINEYARQGWKADELPESCYLVTDSSYDLGIIGHQGQLQVEKYALTIYAFDDCKSLSAYDSKLCDYSSGFKVLTRRKMELTSGKLPDLVLSCEDGKIAGPANPPATHGSANPQGPPLP